MGLRMTPSPMASSVSTGTTTTVSASRPGRWLEARIQAALPPSSSSPSTAISESRQEFCGCLVLWQFCCLFNCSIFNQTLHYFYYTYMITKNIHLQSFSTGLLFLFSSLPLPLSSLLLQPFPLLLRQPILVLLIKILLFLRPHFALVYPLVMPVSHPHLFFSVVAQLLTDRASQQVQDLHWVRNPFQQLWGFYLVLTQV